MTFESIKARALKDLKKYPTDTGLDRYLNAINTNPNAVTKGSCSGLADPKWEDSKEHAGHPYVWVAFRNAQITADYMSKLSDMGYEVSMIKSSDCPYVVYVDLPGTTNGRGARRPRGRMASPSECQRFWNGVTRILSH